MAAVSKRYPGGGGELLVALALADNAAHDGTSIFPGVDDLAKRSRLSRRAVQRHLQGMVSMGWLVVVHVTTGRRGDTNEYRISPQWLDGQACVPPSAPIDRQPKRRPKQLVLVTPDVDIGTGANLSPVSPVDNSRDSAAPQVTKMVLTGDTSVTQTIMNHQDTNTPLTPLPALSGGQLCPNASGKQPNSRTAGLAVMQGAQARALSLPKGTRWIRNRHRVEAVGVRIGLGQWDQAAYERERIRSPGGGAAQSFAAYVESVEQRVKQLRQAAREDEHAAA